MEVPGAGEFASAPRAFSGAGGRSKGLNKDRGPASVDYREIPGCFRKLDTSSNALLFTITTIELLPKFADPVRLPGIRGPIGRTLLLMRRKNIRPTCTSGPARSTRSTPPSGTTSTPTRSCSCCRPPRTRRPGPGAGKGTAGGARRPARTTGRRIRRGEARRRRSSGRTVPTPPSTSRRPPSPPPSSPTY